MENSLSTAFSPLGNHNPLPPISFLPIQVGKSDWGRKGYRIRINAINTPDNSGILAESGQFEIVQGGPDESVSVSVISGTGTTLIGTPTATAATQTSGGSGTPEPIPPQNPNARQAAVDALC